MFRIVPLLMILVFVWASFIFSLYVIVKIIVPLSFPLQGYGWETLSSVMRVVLGTATALFWLYLWKRLAEAYFWRSVKKAHVEG